MRSYEKRASGARAKAARSRPDTAAILNRGDPQGCCDSEPLAKLGLGDPIARDLLALEKQDRDLEKVASFEVGVVQDIELEKLERTAAQDPLDHGAHLLAEMAAGLADEGQRPQGWVRERLSAATGTPRRRSVAMPAPITIDTMVSWTRRPVRSGWIPRKATSGKGTGRGGR